MKEFQIKLAFKLENQGTGHYESKGEGGGDIKVAGNRFRSSVCIYEKSMHKVRRLILKMHEIFTNRLRNVFASKITGAKRFLVKYAILQHTVLSA